MSGVWCWQGRALATAASPFGFNFDGTGFAGCVVVEAAPTVAFRTGDETTLDWVAVNVLELFDEFLPARYVEVVVAALPELFLAG
jgi:hypothetical protein